MKKIFLIFFAVHILLPIYAMEKEKIEKALTTLELNTAFGNTILEYAHQKPLSQEARAEIEYYLNQGANINYGREFETTALNRAVIKYNKDLFNFLLEKGADINVRDCLERTPLYIALIQKLGCFDIKENFLKRGADLNIRKEGSLPLHTAVTFGTTESIKLLIEYGAEIDGKNFLDRTPLNEAIVYKKLEAIEQLCNFGASIININSSDSAFHVAIRQKCSKDLINLLITNSHFASYNKEVDQQLEKKVITAYLVLEKTNIFPKDVQITILSYLALNYFYGFNKKFCKWLHNKNKNFLLTYTFNKVNYLEQVLQDTNADNKTALQLLHSEHKNDLLYIQEVETLVDGTKLQQDRIDFIDGLAKEDNLVMKIYKRSEELLFEK